mgnify:CR=1 FL=1
MAPGTKRGRWRGMSRRGKVVVARRRADGARVFSGLDGWVENIRVATVERSELGLQRRLANAELDVELLRVVDVGAIEVEDHGLGPRPVRMRDRALAHPAW